MNAVRIVRWMCDNCGSEYMNDQARAEACCKKDEKCECGGVLLGIGHNRKTCPIGNLEATDAKR